jgi:hypothetical protein
VLVVFTRICHLVVTASTQDCEFDKNCIQNKEENAASSIENMVYGLRIRLISQTQT